MFKICDYKLIVQRDETIIENKTVVYKDASKRRANEEELKFTKNKMLNKSGLGINSF